MLSVRERIVTGVGGLLGAMVIALLVLVDFHTLPPLPRPQPWVGQVLLPVGIFLWAIVIWRLQLRISKVAQDVAGPPQEMVVNGQSVQVPYKFPNLATLSDAVEGVQGSIAELQQLRVTVDGVSKIVSDLSKWISEVKGPTQWKTNEAGKVVGVIPLKYPDLRELNDVLEDVEERLEFIENQNPPRARKMIDLVESGKTPDEIVAKATNGLGKSK